MANARVSSRNWVDLATTLTATSESPTDGIANVRRASTRHVWKSTSTAAQDISGTWGGDGRPCSMLAIFGHNLHGGTVRLRLYQGAAWTTSAYDSTALTVPTTPLGSHDWGGALGVDPRLYEAPYVLWFAETTAASFTVSIGGSPASGASEWQIARLWLGRYTELSANMEPGFGVSSPTASTQSRAAGGSLRLRQFGRWRQLALDLRSMNEADRATMLDLALTCGATRDVVVSAFPEVGGRYERDYTINGVLLNLNEHEAQQQFSGNRLTVVEA